MFSVRHQIVRSVLVVFALCCLSTTITQAKPLANALWLVTDNDTHSALWMRPIDPVTLKDIPEYKPISMGHHYITASSPDNMLLAAILWPNGYTADGRLHLFNLKTGEDQIAPAKFDDITELTFSADGKSLFWVESTKIDPTHGMPRDFAVSTCEVSNCASPNQIVFLPSEFMPHQAQLLKSGSQLAIFGIPMDNSFLANAAPRILFVDLAAKQITTTLILDGLDAGQHPVKDAAGKNITHYEYNKPGLAWDLAAELLYIAHPTQAKIIVVDLAKQAIKQQVTLSTGRVTGYAKGMMSGTERIALLNPAANRLYISSYYREVTAHSDGKLNLTETPAGVRVIDTAQIKEVQHSNLPFYEMMLSSDGRYLVATGISRQQSSEGVGKLTPSGLYILDAKTLEVLRHIEVENTWVYLNGFSADSRYVYIGLDNIEPNVIPTTLNVIDLTTLEIINKRTLPIGYLDLFGTVNPMRW